MRRLNFRNSLAHTNLKQQFKRQNTPQHCLKRKSRIKSLQLLPLKMVLRKFQTVLVERMTATRKNITCELQNQKVQRFTQNRLRLTFQTKCVKLNF